MGKKQELRGKGKSLCLDDGAGICMIPPELGKHSICLLPLLCTSLPSCSLILLFPVSFKDRDPGLREMKLVSCQRGTQKLSSRAGNWPRSAGLWSHLFATMSGLLSVSRAEEASLPKASFL